MHFDHLTAPEQRVLGCLIEKRYTTPDQYPLSLNALRLACNQSTNRDPVTTYDESTILEAAQRLAKYGLARLASGHSSRATKYRHLAEEALGLDREQLSVLAVLLLRGPQTPGELKARTERMASLRSLDDVEQVIAALGDRGYARRLTRRPGQKEDRIEHLLGADEAGTVPAEPRAYEPPPQEPAWQPPPPAPAYQPPTPASPAYQPPTPAAPAYEPPTPAAPAYEPPTPAAPAHEPQAPAFEPSVQPSEERIEALEAEVADLRILLDAVMADLAELRDELG
jgi:uncharacterized protein YceH (UPF0502 family)